MAKDKQGADSPNTDWAAPTSQPNDAATAAAIPAATEAGPAPVLVPPSATSASEPALTWGPAPTGPPSAPVAWQPADAPASGFGLVQPGVIPLRALRPGDMINGSFKAARFNAGAMYGTTLLYTLAYVTLTAALLRKVIGDFAADPTAWLARPTISDSEGVLLLSITFGSVMLGMFAAGMMHHATARAILGVKVTLAQAWQATAGRRLKYVAWAALFGIGYVLVSLGVAPVFASLATVGGGVPSLLLLLLIFLVPLGVTVVIQIENLRPIAALQRASSLIRGHFGRIYGATAIAMAICFGISTVLAIGGIFLYLGIGDGLGQGSSEAQVLSVATIAALIGVVIAVTLLAPFLAAFATIAYTDLRIRKEGLDLQLAQASQSA